MTMEQNTELQQELERTTSLRGFRYGLHEFVAAVGGVEALEDHNESASYDKPSLIDRNTKSYSGLQYNAPMDTRFNLFNATCTLPTKPELHLKRLWR